jgi:hypothetical protein
MHHPVPARRSAGAQTRRPLWNVRTVAEISAAVALVVACIVFLMGRGSVLEEPGTAVAVIACALLVFLWYGLYSGAILFGESTLSGVRTIGITSVDARTGFPDIDLSGGVSGTVASLVQWVMMTIVLLVLMIFVGTTLWSTLLFLVLVLYWLFFRAVRLLFLKWSVCRGNLIASLQYASFYTVLYTGWIFALVYVRGLLSER